MDVPKYIRILKDAFLGTLQDYGIKARDIYFQQDNDSKHTSILARDFLRSKNIDILNYPSNSPDMSLIEHAWRGLYTPPHIPLPYPRESPQGICEVFLQNAFWTIIFKKWPIYPGYNQENQSNQIYQPMAEPVE